MNLLLIEPYLTGSHKQWAEQLQHHSKHNIQIMALPGRYWKWRMTGAAVTLAKKFMELDEVPDAILVSDMLHLPLFQSLTRSRSSKIRMAVYFHENQITYPWSPDDRDVQEKRDHHYGFINYTSALAADQVFFNSKFHMDSFMAALPKFLKGFPDQQDIDTVGVITKKSKVLSLALDLNSLDGGLITSSGKPLILWNHRWEYDKNPEAFFELIRRLSSMNLDFELAVLGENFSKKPTIFDKAQIEFKDKIVQWGFVKNQATYTKWLWKADLLPVTSNHDFFGISVVEAMYCNTVPVLPNRLVYPSHIPEDQADLFLYNDFEDLVNKTAGHIRDITSCRKITTNAFVNHYDWSRNIIEYDKVLNLLPG